MFYVNLVEKEDGLLCILLHTCCGEEFEKKLKKQGEEWSVIEHQEVALDQRSEQVLTAFLLIEEAIDLHVTEQIIDAVLERMKGAPLEEKQSKLAFLEQNHCNPARPYTVQLLRIDERIGSYLRGCNHFQELLGFSVLEAIGLATARLIIKFTEKRDAQKS